MVPDFNQKPEETALALSVSELPSTRKMDYVIVLDLAKLLRQLIQQYQQVEQLIIPSIEDLAKSFHCSQLDILNTLMELRRQGLQYEYYRLNEPLVFYPSTMKVQPVEPSKPVAETAERKHSRPNHRRRPRPSNHRPNRR